MPFIKSALLAPNGSARSGGSGENINHFNAVRMRVVGTGALKVTLHSLDSVNTQQLADVQLNETTNREPTKLANFIEQRAAIEIKTLTINDYFKINRIIIFTKEFAQEFPQ